jgi:ribosomal protein L20A (L18A)
MATLSELQRLRVVEASKERDQHEKLTMLQASKWKVSRAAIVLKALESELQRLRVVEASKERNQHEKLTVLQASRWKVSRAAIVLKALDFLLRSRR